MIFIFFIIITLTYTIAIGIYKKFALIKPKKYIKLISIITIIISLIYGISEGTFYSHGFDVPWWIFSIAFFIIILTTAIILAILMRIKLLKK